MTAKEYLSQVSRLDAWIYNKRRQIEDLKEKLLATGGTDYGKERVKSSLPTDPLADRIAYYVAKEEELNKQIDRYIDLRDRITQEINSLGDARYITLLSKRYLERKSLTQVAQEMAYDYAYACKLHSKALETFARVNHKSIKAAERKRQ